MCYTRGIECIFYNCRFCRTSESSFWVEIPILQDYQLLNKYYYYLSTFKTLPKDTDWQDLAKVLPYSSKHWRMLLSPPLLSMLISDSPTPILPAPFCSCRPLKDAAWAKTKAPFSGGILHAITVSCWNIKAWPISSMGMPSLEPYGVQWGLRCNCITSQMFLSNFVFFTPP